MSTRILCVCLGNICRSPAAEVVLRAKAAECGLAIDVDSAGTSDWHAGVPPYGPMIDAALARGYDLRPVRARQVGVKGFHAFNLILGMDDANMTRLRALDPGTAARLQRFDAGKEVPDPYSTRDFEETLDIIEAASDALLAQLSQNA